jgi:hypothetical protein
MRHRIEPTAIASKIGGDQIVRTSAAANIDLGGSRAYQIAVCVKGSEKTRLIAVGIRLDAPQGIFVDEK